MKRILILWIVLGAAYVTIEVLWRGHTHPSMFVVGGLCGVLVGLINQIPRFYRAPVVVQSLIGAAIVLIVEFLSGCVLNLWLGLGVWDYSGQFGNILGQVCAGYAVLWVFLMPFAIWAEDTGRWLIHAWDKLLRRSTGPPPQYPPYTIRRVYADFFTGK
ncbi:MAG: putative ABC transporter permease [Oscillospiraceae bacterium]|jgi:uncharacterized membrane protein|nr:putative ABC transporter permease [Oscillospiraceae bacterium]